MKNSFTIRPFVRGDQKAVKSLILAGLGEHFEIINPKLNPDLNDIFSSYIEHGHIFVVCESNATLVGTGALIKEKKEVGRIVRVSVAGSHRKQGIGRLITEHLISAATMQGYNQIVVETNDDWVGAIRLYQQCGFKEYDHCNGEIHLIKFI